MALEPEEDEEYEIGEQPSAPARPLTQVLSKADGAY